MLHLQRQTGERQDRYFREFPQLLRSDDLLVFNNTRVFPARLYGQRSGSRSQPVSPRNPAAREFLHGRVEVLLTRSLGQGRWEALVRPGRKIGVGEKLYFGVQDSPVQLEAEVVARGEFGERTLQFAPTADFFAAVEAIGHVPLPPYIDRSDQPADRDRYQTVFARETGSAAAPTAGLHFTPEILQQIQARGIETAEVTLHVGLGTFQPLRHERVEDNTLHHEVYRIEEQAAAQINRARQQARRVVAVGTTTVRTLEAAALSSRDGVVSPGTAETNLFIYPGFEFRVTGALFTNFHLPQSSLLMLVCAFAGREQVLSAYEHAVEERYRFFSYGDCMFVE
jgi:S-adenosylmethionine:tRNA ribosyltransferase-isomerase